MMASVALLHGCGSGTFYAHVMPFPSFYLTFPLYLSLFLMDVWRMHEARSTASGVTKDSCLSPWGMLCLSSWPFKMSFFFRFHFLCIFFFSANARALSSLYKA
jgi:hypothetical protein